MHPTRLLEDHEQNGTRAHNGKVISAIDAERIHTLPPAPEELWPAGKKRWEVQGAALVKAGVLVDRDLPVLLDHCEIFQQKQAWLASMGDEVAKNGGKMPLGNEQIERCALHLAKLHAPFNATCEFLGIGALQRTKRGNSAKAKGTAGGVVQKAKPVATKRKGR